MGIIKRKREWPYEKRKGYEIHTNAFIIFLSHNRNRVGFACLKQNIENNIFYIAHNKKGLTRIEYNFYLNINQY